MLSIEPKDIPVQQLHGYLLSAVAPRPIAFASTIDEEGNPTSFSYERQNWAMSFSGSFEQQNVETVSPDAAQSDFKQFVGLTLAVATH